MQKNIVAIALVTSEELEMLGPNFPRAYAVQDAPCYGEMLSAIDRADREFWHQQDEDRRHGERMIIGAEQ